MYAAGVRADSRGAQVIQGNPVLLMACEYNFEFWRCQETVDTSGQCDSVFDTLRAFVVLFLVLQVRGVRQPA